MKYTLAICTHNHADHLAVTLPALSRLAPPDGSWEVLIIDNASTDATADLLADPKWHVPGVANRVVREARLGVANARNRAVMEARGEYVAFLDDDETPDPDWLRALERHIDAYRPDAVGGPYRVLFEDASRPTWLQDELLPFLGALDYGPEPKVLTSPSTPIWTGNVAFRKGALEEYGLFDPDLGRRGGNQAGGEDTEMYRRLLARGCTLRWAPDAIIYHRIRANKLLRSFFLSLGYQQGRIEGTRGRGERSRIPPPWLCVELGRTVTKALRKRMAQGGNHSLRVEMDACYQIGYFTGWMAAPRWEGTDGAPS